VRSWAELSLWAAQNDALTMCERYFARPDRSALVQMPTGAGKTGVIAVISSLRSRRGAVLVLAPSEALVMQLQKDIAEDFWATIGARDRWKPGGVTLVLPSLEKDVSAILRKTGSRQVLVATFQALQQIHEKQPTYYEMLKSRTKTVLIDEGHREPALAWAEAVRDLERPTILFSATPYRNDQRLFNVSDNYFHYLSFDDSLRANYIRDIRFVELRSSPAAAEFAQSVTRTVQRLIRTGTIAPDSKVIIHASDAAKVAALHNAFDSILQGTTDSCVSFHETFDGRTANMLAAVPDLRTRTERYFIHQYKLIEGLDEPRFAVFVPYDDFGNSRQLVQQIGRIIRNPTPKAKPAHLGVVLTPRWSKAERLWLDYRRFDQECDRRGTPLVKTAEFLSNYLASLPSLEYTNRKFSKRADFADPTIFDDLAIPRSCVIYVTEIGFSTSSLASELKHCIELDDRLILKDRVFPTHSTYVALSVRVGNSQLLADSFFPEFSLHLTVGRLQGSYLFGTDTAGLQFDDIRGVEGRLPTDALRSLFPDKAGTRITSISARNSDIGATAVRMRSMSARSLEEAAPFMGDYLHMVSNARGQTAAGETRYVGFSRGRVRDEERGSCSLSEYSSWTSKLADQLDVRRRPVQYLRRFSAPVSPPPNPNAKNILLDIEAVEGRFLNHDGDSPERIKDLCADVEAVQGGMARDARGRFRISANGMQRAIEIRYEHDRHRYKLESAFLNSFVDQANKKTTLLARINQAQAFRVLCGSAGYVYSSGEFFRIADEVGMENLRIAIKDLLTPVPALETIHSEKGQGPGNGTNWDADSLFRFIDDGLQQEQGPLSDSFDEVICDDLGSEVADFIAFRESQGGKIVFIHAKADQAAAGAGASKLYEVCGQAMKNLVYLRHGARPIPSQVQKWEGDWRVRRYRVFPRIRRETGTSAEVRQRLGTLLDGPNTQREMWLTLGGILSQGALDTSLSQTTPEYYAVQAAYLLLSADLACKSVGVRLRAFCAP
jgi:superfamily II DNA or RNA helicase